MISTRKQAIKCLLCKHDIYMYAENTRVQWYLSSDGIDKMVLDPLHQLLSDITESSSRARQNLTGP